MKINEIKELINTLDQSSIQNFEMEQSNIKIKISKSDNSTSSIKEIVSDSTNQNTDFEVIELTNDSDDIVVVNSPMVGVFYTASSPTTEAFVKKGDHVNQGDILCIIEAMKIMNEIESDIQGEVIEILVNNEDIVEYGQPIMKIRRF